ncbi:MAG: hypothetical protein ABJ092_15250 [Gillisia sp.]
MKKLTYLLFLAIGVTACSVESIDSTENLLVADAKAKVTVATSVVYDATVCFGEDANFTFNFPQAYNSGNGNTQKTLVILELWNELSGEWNEIHQGNYDGAGPQYFSYEFGAEGTYQLRHRIGTGNNWTEISVSVVDCSDCEESFSYVENENGSYTFTYVPAEDMDDANLVFTLAQSDSDTGLEGWEDKGATKQKTMDLAACQVYTWTVTLTPDCNASQPNSQAWTDFKVNGVSKKNTSTSTPIIVKSCN